MRKNALRTSIAALLIASTLSATAYAETALVTGSEVNVRSGPGADFAILGSYSRGDTVEVLDRRDGSWYTVDFNGTVGYMSADFLSLQADGSAVILGDAPAAQTPGQAVIQTPAPESSGILVTPGLPSASAATNGEVTGMYVRFRSGPSDTTAILGEFSEGKAVTILGTEGDWTLCLIDGEYGYIASQYVRYTAAPAATPAPTESIIITPAPTAILVTPAPVPGSSGTAGQQTPAAAQSVYGQSVIIGYPSPTPAPTPVPGTALVLVTPAPVPAASSGSSSDSNGIITGDYVRFRRGPGSDYSIIRTFDHGTAVNILGTEGDWVYCTIDGTNGYVFSQYIQAAAAQTPAPSAVPDAVQTVAEPQPSVSPVSVPLSTAGSPGYIKGNNVRFRSGPDLSADIIGELYYGNEVTITGSDGTWTSLICKGQPGYVFSQYVAPGALQTTSGGTAAPSSASGREIADYALQYVGTPYHWGGVDPSTGFDCSGFAYYVYKHFGYTLNRVASEQALNGRHVENTDLQPGDLICFYSGGSYIGHVGIYIGNNMFVHAATSSTGVISSELTGYYARRGFEVRRIVS